MKKSLILDHDSVHQKVKRMAYQILEENADEAIIHLLGIQTKGCVFAEMLFNCLKEIDITPVALSHLEIDKSKPHSSSVKIDTDVLEFTKGMVILVDDVANTGRTLFYALQPLQSILPKKIEVAVLVDRRHKAWPIYVTYSGLDLSTTLGDNVLIHFDGAEGDEAVLE